jgi:hypothetical protein
LRGADPWQAVAGDDHGARVIQVKEFRRQEPGHFDCGETSDPLVTRLTLPKRRRCIRIVDDFEGYAPHCHVLPVGNAGNITAY